MSNEEFEILVNDLSDTLYRFAYFRTQREELAQDAVQESLVKLWNEQKPMSHYLNIKAYCMTLVKNKCIDILRLESTRKKYEDQNKFHADQGNVEHKFEREDKLKLMNYYLDQINEKQARALKLRDFEDYSYLEIANIIGESQANVKILIHRGRNALKNLLKQNNGVQQATY